MTSITELPRSERFVPLLKETSDAFSENARQNTTRDPLEIHERIQSTAGVFGAIAAITDMITHPEMYPPDILTQALRADFPNIEGHLEQYTTWHPLGSFSVRRAAKAVALVSLEERAPFVRENLTTKLGLKEHSLSQAQSILRDHSLITSWERKGRFQEYVPTVNFAAQLCSNESWHLAIREE